MFLNGGVYTLDPAQAWVEAVAVSGNKVIFTGSNEDGRQFIGPNTKVSDLNGKMLLPGFGDTHLHLLYGGETISACSLEWEDDPAEIARILKACESKGDSAYEDWLYGTRWARWSFPDGSPPASFLNDLFPDRPVMVEASDGHSLWVNQVALDRAGISRDTPDPPNGQIVRDPVSGRATGLVHESAMRLVSDAMPGPAFESQLGFIRKALGLAHQHGITSAIEPGLNLEQAGYFTALDRLGEMNLRVLLALTPIGFEIAAFDDEIYRTTARRGEVEGKYLQANSVKVFADGVIENGTSELLEPYLSESVAPLPPFYKPEDMKDYFIRLDREGISIHVHAIGDLGIRQTLDAFEAMRETNGKSDNRHLITHLQLISDEDIARFAELDIISSFATYWAYPEEYNLEVYPPLVGQDRINRFYPVASIYREGGMLTVGSDWTVTDLNPFLGIETALTRQDPHSDTGPALNENERISLETALEAYTLNAAYAMGLEDQTGSIEPGKLADLVVLDRNLFEIPVYEISETQVLLTLFNGEIVFESGTKQDQ